MPISLVKPLQEIASMESTLKKQAKEDKPKEMTEYQKEKVEIAKKNQELKEKSLASKTEATNVLKEKEARLKEKQSYQQQRISKESEARIEKDKMKYQIELQNAKNQEIKEKRLLQNSKNREKRIEAQKNLFEEVYSITTTNKNSRSSLGTLKTGPQKLGFNIIQEGGVEDE